jgi:hypothetical protein
LAIERELAASGGEKSRQRGSPFRADLERGLTRVLPEAHHCPDAPVGSAPEVPLERLARLAGVDVRIDDGGHDRAAGDAQAGCTGGNLHLGAPAHLSNDAVDNEDRCVLERWTPVADDDAGGFEERGR